MITLPIVMLVGLTQAPPKAPAVLLIAPDESDNQRLADIKALIPLTSADQGVMFDLDGDGMLEQVAWTPAEANYAFVAIDHNGNGKIDNGTELVTDRFHPGARDAIQALGRRMSINGPLGWLDVDDPLFPKLLMWTDRNHDGRTDPGELRPASEVVARIGLGYLELNRRDDQGNHFRYRGWVRMRSAPGLNGPAFREAIRERLRTIFEVILAK